MRKLVVGLTAVLLVGLPATAAYAPPTQKCPSPETLKFEANKQGQFTIGESHGGITLTGQSANSLTFTVSTGVVVDQICIKAGTTATVFNNFDADGSTTVGNFTITSDCTVVDIEPDGDTDLWAQSGPCTVTITRSGGPGFSHITFYAQSYTAPAAVEAQVQSAGVSGSGSSSSGGLAFTGAQITMLLVLLVSLIAAGTLAWTTGRRRAAKSD
jgi:hypothetical protein